MGAGQSNNKISAHDKAVLDLKIQRDKLKQYQRRLQIVLTNEHEIAKQALASGQKSKALTALRQKKYQEQLLMKTDSQLITLQDLLSSIEFTQLQSTLLKSLSTGADVLKELHKEVNLESVERVMDRVNEGVQAQREIDEALMSKMSPEEEEEVQAELAALERENLALAEPPTPAKLPSLPNVPTADPLVPIPAEDAASREEELQEAQKEERVAMLA